MVKDPRITSYIKKPYGENKIEKDADMRRKRDREKTRESLTISKNYTVKSEKGQRRFEKGMRYKGNLPGMEER